MVFHLSLLHRSGRYFASVFTVSVGFFLLKSEKSVSNISSVSLTVSGVAFILD